MILAIPSFFYVDWSCEERRWINIFSFQGMTTQHLFYCLRRTPGSVDNHLLYLSPKKLHHLVPKYLAPLGREVRIGIKLLLLNGPEEWVYE